MTLSVPIAAIVLAASPAGSAATPDPQTEAPEGIVAPTDIAVVIAQTQSAKRQTTQQGVTQPVTPAEEIRSPAAPGSTPYPSRAIGENRTSTGYASSRWGEDWRRMAKEGNRDDFLDQLKYLPLNEKGDIYITLSGEVRFRPDVLSNARLVERPVERRDRLRLIAGADLHITPHFRLYGELAHGGLSGTNLSTTQTNFKNDLVIQQAFAEVTGEVANVEVGARYGRQEYADGSSLILSTRDFNTIRFVVNGVRLWARGSRLRAGLFDFEYTDLGAGGLSDDKSDEGTRFTGGNLGIVLPETLLGKSQLFFDPYVWRLKQEDFVWGRTTAEDKRTYYGTRLWGRAGRFDVDWNINYQSGSFGARDVSAWHVFTATNYRLGEERNAPSTGIRVDYGSGGGAYGTGTLKTATTPFGANAPFSYQIALTPTNLFAITPGFSFTPFDGFQVDLEYQFSFRPAEDDAVYRPINRPYNGTERVDGKRVADLPRIQTRWSITSRLFLGTRTEYLIGREVLDRAGYADSFFTSAWLSFRI